MEDEFNLQMEKETNNHKAKMKELDNALDKIRLDFELKKTQLENGIEEKRMQSNERKEEEKHRHEEKKLELETKKIEIEKKKKMKKFK